MVFKIYKNNKKTVCILLSLIFLISFVVAVPTVTIDSPIDSFTVIGDSVPLNWNVDTVNETINSCGFSLDGGITNTSIFSPSDLDYRENSTERTAGNTSVFAFLNYTIPENSISAIWQVEYIRLNITENFTSERRLLNLSIPSICFDSDPNKLLLKLTTDINCGDYRIAFSCFNNTDYQDVLSDSTPCASCGFSRSVQSDLSPQVFDGIWGGQGITFESGGGHTSKCRQDPFPFMAVSGGIVEEAIIWNISEVIINPTLTSLTEGSHDVVIACNNSLGLIGQASSSFNVFIPLFPNEIVGKGELFSILRSSGAGLSIFIQVMGFALPTLILGILFVGIIVIIGFGIARIFDNIRLKE